MVSILSVRRGAHISLAKIGFQEMALFACLFCFILFFILNVSYKILLILGGFCQSNTLGMKFRSLDFLF